MPFGAPARRFWFLKSMVRVIQAAQGGSCPGSGQQDRQQAANGPRSRAAERPERQVEARAEGALQRREADFPFFRQLAHHAHAEAGPCEGGDGDGRAADEGCERQEGQKRGIVP